MEEMLDLIQRDVLELIETLQKQMFAFDIESTTALKERIYEIYSGISREHNAEEIQEYNKGFSELIDRGIKHYPLEVNGANIHWICYRTKTVDQYDNDARYRIYLNPIPNKVVTVIAGILTFVFAHHKLSKMKFKVPHPNQHNDEGMVRREKAVFYFYDKETYDAVDKLIKTMKKEWFVNDRLPFTLPIKQGVGAGIDVEPTESLRGFMRKRSDSQGNPVSYGDYFSKILALIFREWFQEHHKVDKQLVAFQLLTDDEVKDLLAYTMSTAKKRFLKDLRELWQ